MHALDFQVFSVCSVLSAQCNLRSVHSVLSAVKCFRISVHSVLSAFRFLSFSLSCTVRSALCVVWDEISPSSGVNLKRKRKKNGNGGGARQRPTAALRRINWACCRVVVGGERPGGKNEHLQDFSN